MTAAIAPLLERLRTHDDMSADEEAMLRWAISDIRSVRAGHATIREGEELSHAIVLLQGFMCRHKDLSEGRRQITEIHIPGDFVDLHGFTLKKLSDSVTTLTPCRIGIVPHERLLRITETHPHLTRLLWFTTNLDAAIHREWVLSLGRRPAIERLAHLFCELHFRLTLVGHAPPETPFPLPLTQADLADCLGLTSVHVNRVLQELRDSGAVEFRKREVTIRDLGALRALAEFDPAYLHPERRPR
ncbi:helix-turn-helix domain-containing protein [Sphingobium lignivorans]|uniref:CRP-like cAMP-binding protein n=1 Tax=Sphingobium lignivorans TaxID=2735886 RepID=A0ABR6NCP1_9SPHN|nr:CRP-like cAMP-binding protein [Sphingobium lignivorans]